MCFGNKNDAGDGEAPRPAQNHQPSYAAEQKRASVPAQYQQQQQQQQQPYAHPASHEYAPPSGPPPSHRPPPSAGRDDFAPPPGPPPSHRMDDFAPPPGPPPSSSHQRHDDYAAPSGPPPGHRRSDDFAPPAGPPPGHRDDFAPPPGPPPSQRHDDFAPPAGPPPGHRADDFAPPPGPPPSQRYDDFAPPAGPPPSHRVDDFAPPPGPPPSQRYDDFAPPAGPPPGHRDDFAPPPGPPPGPPPSQRHGDFAPPPGPLPSHQPHNDLSYIAPPPGPPPTETKPKHDWETVVPDTSLFPPPPSFFSGWDRSPANNATEAAAAPGEQWCAQHPLTAPITLDGPAVAALNAHNPRLMQPDGFRGTLACVAPGLWKASTTSQAADSTIIAYPPLYTVTLHSPLSSPTHTKTIYYEVQLARSNPRTGDICLALGYAALPYPSFRMPGWHRGSLAVHGDDGHKFVNDRWGGKSFTAPFVAGERYGVGMTFTVVSGGRVDTEVFFTRQGVEAGRWNLHEETDAQQDLPVTGLEGYHDLSCAVGTSGQTEFEVVLDPARWLYRPPGYY